MDNKTIQNNITLDNNNVYKLTMLYSNMNIRRTMRYYKLVVKNRLHSICTDIRWMIFNYKVSRVKRSISSMYNLYGVGLR